VAAKLKKPKVIISAVAILVVVALVIAGISTSAFGLIGGGARSAESEAKQVVKKVEALVNSFNAKSVLSNPLASFGDLSKELAPSETRLGASGGSLDLVEALGISSETLGWLTDLAGAFTVKTKDIAVNTFSITDDIALARLTGGTLTIEVNSAALRTALNKTSGIIDQQLGATAKAYGFDLNLYAFGSTSLGESLLYDMLYMPKNWVDQLVSEVEASFPLTIDFAAEWRDWQDCLKSKYQGSYNRCGGDYSDISSFILVKEQGKWYLSWMLTSNFTSFDLDVNASIKDWVQANWDDLEIGWDSTFDEWQKQNCAISDELASKLNVVPATNKSPLEAANAMVRALQSGDQRAVLAQLPLAERRYAAMSGTLNDFEATIAGNSGGNPTFSLINQKGDWATLKIVDLRVTEPGRYGADIGISDGTCYHTYPGSDIYCLTEELNKIDTDQLNELFDPNNKVWSDLGIDPQVLTTKIKLAIRTATDAIDPEAIGVVAIKESNSWHISASATSSQLLNQLTTALFEGLKAARK
jgi:hypothetical protein